MFKKRLLFPMVTGEIKAIPPYTEEDHINWFREAYAKANPINEGTFPIKWKELYPEENRWCCIGGPMDENEGIAKLLKVKKGRGRNAVEVLVPINPPTFSVIIGDKEYVYYFNQEDESYYCS